MGEISVKGFVEKRKSRKKENVFKPLLTDIVQKLAANPGKDVELDMGTDNKEERIKKFNKLRWTIKFLALDKDNDALKSIRLVREQEGDIIKVYAELKEEKEKKLSSGKRKEKKDANTVKTISSNEQVKTEAEQK